MRYLNIKQEWALTPPLVMLICNDRCRRTQEREPANTGWCSAIQRYKILQKISRFPRRCSLWCSTDSLGQISFITIWLFVLISAYLTIKHRIFRTLRTSDSYRYQTQERNIMKFYLLIQKHLTMQLTKLPIDILNLDATFWHYKINPITFEHGCTTRGRR